VIPPVNYQLTGLEVLSFASNLFKMHQINRFNFEGVTRVILEVSLVSILYHSKNDVVFKREKYILPP
jgi:hypothetical protein